MFSHKRMHIFVQSWRGCGGFIVGRGRGGMERTNLGDAIPRPLSCLGLMRHHHRVIATCVRAGVMPVHVGVVCRVPMALVRLRGQCDPSRRLLHLHINSARPVLSVPLLQVVSPSLSAHAHTYTDGTDLPVEKICLFNPQAFPHRQPPLMSRAPAAGGGLPLPFPPCTPP
jgi:hypothetical protein